MLGSRTKQIFSYGKRSQRIVNVSEERCMPQEAGNIFDDLEPAQWAPIASRMKKRENNIPCKPRTPSPKVIRMNRKKRLSPVLPSAKKQHRLAQIMDAEATKRESSSTNGMTKVSSSKAALDTASIPPRTPFSHFPLNVPGSPAIPAGWSPPGMGPPPKRNKPFSPFVDMDIIILDENRKAVKQERRVSRTRVEGDPFNHGKANKLKGPFTQGKPSRHPTDTADSDSDFIKQSEKPKRLARRAPLIVYSDDSESDDNDSAPIPQAHKTATALHSLLNRGVGAESSRAVNSIHPTKTTIKTASQPVLPQVLPAPATSYQPLPSPPLRPRQLTPIRGSHGRHLFEPPSPPSPACTDLDLSLEFEELTLASLSHVDTSCRSEPEHPTYLRPLLEECHQEKCGPIDFSSFIDTFPFDPVVRSENGKPTGATFRKVGEASYSEVFGIGDVVLKVIPLRDESNDEASTNKLKMNVKCNDSGEVEDGPAPSDAKDVRKEIIVTRAMGEVCDGFVKLLKTYIVRGKYPEVLLGLWDEYHESKGSESVRPGMCYTALKF
jgi:serine/threonine-protein kinase haspin